MKNPFVLPGLQTRFQVTPPHEALYRLNVCVPPKFICGSLDPSVAVFGDGTPKKVIKVK